MTNNEWDGIYQGEVVGIEVYNNDVVVKRRGLNGKKSPSTRSEIGYFSYRSRRRLAFVASNTDVELNYMITLTYPDDYPTDGKMVKGHLNKYLKRLRRMLPDVEYLWFIEFQKRGAPHFHLLIDKDPTRQKWRVSRDWFEIVGSWDEKHLRAGTRCEEMRRSGARYAVKYAMKMKQKRVPKIYRDVGRFWGHSKKVKPEARAWHDGHMSDEQLADLLKHWQYAESAVENGYATLYNATESVIKKLEEKGHE